MNIIETSRLQLHKVTPEIYEELFRTKEEQELKDFLGITTDAAWQTELQKQEQGLTKYRISFLSFYIKEKASGKTIGSCGFHTWYLPHSRAEIGYAITDESRKQQGFMKEALLAVIQYGFEEMQINRIEAFIGPGNIASIKLVQAMGFKKEGLLREHYCKDGDIQDSLVFGLLRKEFEL